MVRLYEVLMETGVEMKLHGNDDNGRIHITLSKKNHTHTFDIGLMGANEETIENLVVEAVYKFYQFVDDIFKLATA